MLEDHQVMRLELLINSVTSYAIVDFDHFIRCTVRIILYNGVWIVKRQARLYDQIILYDWECFFLYNWIGFFYMIGIVFLYHWIVFYNTIGIVCTIGLFFYTIGYLIYMIGSFFYLNRLLFLYDWYCLNDWIVFFTIASFFHI